MSEAPVALVTGGATGIGAACCRRLAAEGIRIAVHYRSSEERAQKLVAELPDALALRADLSSAEEVEALVLDLRERVGGVDVLVNNAGSNVNAPMLAMKLDDYDAMAGLARGTWYLTKLVLRRLMRGRNGGRIINISSVVAQTGNAGQIPYTMHKAGIEALTRSLAQEMASRGILVNAVAPGFIDTEMSAAIPKDVARGIVSRIPLGRTGTPEEVADVVAFLATRGDYVNGTVVHVNGGLYGG